MSAMSQIVRFSVRYCRAVRPQVGLGRGPNRRRETVTLASNLIIHGTPVCRQGLQQHYNSINTLPVLPAISSQRLRQQTKTIENRVAVEALTAFQACLPMERNTMMYKYLTDMEEYENQQRQALQVIQPQAEKVSLYRSVVHIKISET